MHQDPVVVARYSYRHEAEFAKSYLDASGIDADVDSDDANGFEVALSFSNSVRLLVRAEDAERAREVLAAAEAPPDALA